MTFTLPKKYEYLTKTKKISHDGSNLLTIYLIHLIDHIIREYTYDELKVPLYSVVMKQIYGNNYSDYVKYLEETGFIKKDKKYSTIKHHSTLYRVTDRLSKVFVYRGYDYKLQKKLTNFYDNLKPQKVNSPIPVEIRQKLIDDLKSVTIDFEGSVNFILDKVKDNPSRFTKNLSMINKIKDGDLFYTFDKWGRFHSNFTNLKSEIRKQFLKIDGQPMGCLDVKSSQPFWLSQVMKREVLISDVEEVQRFIKILEDKNQDIYILFVDKYPEIFNDPDPDVNRRNSKMMVIKSLFDRTRRKVEHKELFKKEFPYISEYMDVYKYDSFQELWVTLQKMESDFIFKKVYRSIVQEIPTIKLMTVHDSISYPIQYHDKIKIIWDKHWLELVKRK